MKNMDLLQWVEISRYWLWYNTSGEVFVLHFLIGPLLGYL